MDSRTHAPKNRYEYKKPTALAYKTNISILKLEPLDCNFKMLFYSWSLSSY